VTDGAFWGARPTPAPAFTAYCLRLAKAPLGLALAWALIAALPLFSDPGFLNTRGIGDSPNLLFRVHQLLAALQSGEFPARWMPDAAYGYGQPYFTYYASFSTYLAALLKLYGFSYVHALKLTQLLALLGASGALYGWLRAARLTPAQAALGAAAYTFAPFHLVNLYVRGDSLAELWAMALYPLTLWAAHLCVEGLTFRRALALALSLATLVCTHNISALNFLPFVGLYLLSFQLSAFSSQRSAVSDQRSAVSGQRSNPQSAIKNQKSLLLPSSFLLLPLLWGLALSAFFWLPALRESAFVQLDGLTGGYFFYGNHFRSADLLNAALLFDYAGNPFSVGLVQAALAALGLGVMLWRAWRARAWPWLNSFVLLGLLLSMSLVTPLSKPLWDALPLLAYTQFPWRFLSILALFTAALTARFWIFDFGFSITRRALLSTFYFLAPAALALSTLLPLRLEFFPLADSDVTAARLNLYEYFTTAIGNTVNSEYLPREVKPRPFTSEAMLGRAPRPKVFAGAASGERLWKRGASEQWAITVAGDSGATVAVPTHYWPGWQAEAAGQPLAVRAAPGLGWLSFDLPPGAHTVTLRLGRTLLRLATEVFSLLALLVPLGLWVVRRPFTATFTPSPLHLVALFLLVIGFLALRLNLQSPISTGPLNADFDALPYFHHDVVRFADGTQLIGARYDRERLRPGETFTLTTEWRIARPGPVRFALVSPALRVAGQTPLVTEVQELTVSGAARLTTRLTVADHVAPGVYFVAVELLTEQGVVPALTSAGRARGLVHLAPLWVESDPQAETASPLQSFLGFDLLTTTAQPDGESLRLDLRWRATAELPLNYVLALRMRDADGNELAALDTQPNAGFYPTALWRPGQAVPDSLRLSLPAGLPPAAYTVTVSPYDPLTLAPLGTAAFSVAWHAPLPLPPAAPRWPLTDALALDRLELPTLATQGESLELVAHWVTVTAPTENLRARWTLTSVSGAHIETVPLAPGSAPRAWAAQAQYVGRARLALPADLAPGTYTLRVQLVNERGDLVGDEAQVGVVEVVGRAREFVAPPVQTPVGATFAGQIALLGYNAQQTRAELQLELVFRALAAPRGDYKYFVHLFNPADEAIAGQVDAVPRAFTYPTTLWVKDEVVTETVALSLTGVPPGMYRLAMGWYDPATPDLARLPAFDTQGRPLEDGRVVLPLEVRIED